MGLLTFVSDMNEPTPPKQHRDGDWAHHQQDEEQLMLTIGILLYVKDHTDYDLHDSYHYIPGHHR